MADYHLHSYLESEITIFSSNESNNNNNINNNKSNNNNISINIIWMSLSNEL